MAPNVLERGCRIYAGYVFRVLVLVFLIGIEDYVLILLVLNMEVMNNNYNVFITGRQ